MVRLATDYGVLLDRFLGSLPEEDLHKSFTKKISNRLARYHKRHSKQANISLVRVLKAVEEAEAFYADNNKEISIGAVCWAIHNKHSMELSPYGLNKEWFEQLNRYYGAQGVARSSLQVVMKIEEYMYKG